MILASLASSSLRISSAASGRSVSSHVSAPTQSASLEQVLDDSAAQYLCQPDQCVVLSKRMPVLGPS